MIEQRDNEQDSYQRHYYGADGHQPNFYHLLINTGLFSFESAANLIQQAFPTIQEDRVKQRNMTPLERKKQSLREFECHDRWHDDFLQKF